ncbi:hypothetical protein AVEN_2129-1 [Araneus ventricosus]|uniref:Reverse transcriptase domain-containing protein n=1 Tax=Araneus ventricosus TaxID=182803 RepID=A0A4Y2ECJ6_ARAVE|nr:hypothetical protein AVEN_2129-1 [Araneus ventricosus]
MAWLIWLDLTSQVHGEMLTFSLLVKRFRFRKFSILWVFLEDGLMDSILWVFLEDGLMDRMDSILWVFLEDGLMDRMEDGFHPLGLPGSREPTRYEKL